MDMQAVFDNWRGTVTDHFFDMHGRVGRAQFWYFVLVNFAFLILLSILQSATFLPLATLFNLAMLFPTAGMGARRLQDIGRDGKLVWAFIILGFVSQIVMMMTMWSFFTFGFMSFFLLGPQLVLIKLALLVVCVVLLYFWCQPGDAGDNAYGPPPPVFNPSAKPAV